MGCTNCQDTKTQKDLIMGLDNEIVEEKEKKKIFKKEKITKKGVCPECGCDKSHYAKWMNAQKCDNCGAAVK